MTEGRLGRAVSLLILAALAALPVAARLEPSWAAPPGGSSGIGPAPTTKPPRPPATKPATGRPAPAFLPSGRLDARALPDSVLALVNGARTVTVADFRRGWAQVLPPSRPDSLTPQGARQFLDLLVDKELLAERAGQETWEWSTVESVQVANLRDRTMLRVALDSTLALCARQRAARGDSALGPEALGVAARESTVARLAVSYDELLLSRLAKAWGALPRPTADSSLWARMKMMGQMPAIEPADSARVVAWSGLGTTRVSDLLEAWKKLNPLFRPRVETADQVRDLVKNALFERVLRRDATERHYERHPAVARAVRRQEEYLASQYFVTREVYNAIPLDDAVLRRYYQKDPGAWTIPARLRVVRMVLPDRAEASRMAVRLRDPAEADTLVARGMRQHVDYTAEISARTDSALFAAAMKSGTGAVLGPDSLRGGWQVVRVSAVLPAQERLYEEVKDLVLRAYSDEEGERRMKALLAGLRKRARVVVNRPALERLAATPIPLIRPGR